MRDEGKGEVLVFGGRVIGYRPPPGGVTDKELDKIFVGTKGGMMYCPPCRLIFKRPDGALERCPQCGGVPHSLLRAELDGVIVPEWRRRRRP